jgi:hypothetical protein
VRVSFDIKRFLLIPLTSLAVTYLRHGIESHWASWNSIEQFLTSWFVHTFGLLLFMALTTAIILWSHEFFFEKKASGEAEEFLPTYIVMAVLVAAVAIIFLAHWPVGSGIDD